MAAKLDRRKQEFTRPHMKTAIVVVSDTCAADPSSDKTSTVLKAAISESPLAPVTSVTYVPDESETIKEAVQRLVSTGFDLILTAGGTGFSPRDVTPEAIKPLLEKEAPGLVAAMLHFSTSITPLGALSRPVAGVIQSSLVIALPGSPKGAVENFNAIEGVLPHALVLLTGANSREVHASSHEQSDLGSSHTHTHSHSHAHSHSHSHSEIDSLAHTHSHTHSHSHSGPHHSHGAGPKFYGPAFRERESSYPLIDFDDAMSLVLSNTPDPVPSEISLEKALGSVLCKDIHAPVNVPSFRASIVDGYAVFQADFANEFDRILPVSKVSHASSAVAVLPPHTCARITTGAPVPHGATAVVPVENTQLVEERNGEEVSVRFIVRHIKSGDNIREIGSDVSLGSRVLKQDTVISSLGGEIGIMASLGIAKVPVYRKPVVGVLSTGDEVVDTGSSLYGSAIWDANRPMLLANLRTWLGEDSVVDCGIAKDTKEALKSKVVTALEKVDVLVTSGGVSMGELDLLKGFIQEIGGDIKFGRVLMKPGKPVTFATLPKKKLIIALPGNPVSCVVCLQLFGYPMLMRMMGKLGKSSDPNSEWMTVELKSDVKLDSRPEFQRGIVTQSESGKWIWDSTGAQRSSTIASMVRANALIRLPPATPDAARLPRGSQVKALFLSISR